MPADEAFTFMADLRNFAQWDPGVTNVEQLESGSDAKLFGV